MKVGAVTDGIRSFTMTPYVFSNLADARSYIGLPNAFTSYFLLRLKQKGQMERVRQDILGKISDVQALTTDQFRDQSRSFWLSGTGAGAALLAGALLSVIVGTAIIAQTLYSSTKEHLYEFATLRAIGASNSYIYRVIISQALFNAFIGFGMAGLIGLAVVRLTAKSALQIAISPSLLIELFLLTVIMCIISAVAAIVQRHSRRPCGCADAMTSSIIEAVNVSKVLGSGPARVQALKNVSLALSGGRFDSPDGAFRQRQDHTPVDPWLHARAHAWDCPSLRYLHRRSARHEALATAPASAYRLRVPILSSVRHPHRRGERPPWRSTSAASVVAKQWPRPKRCWPTSA